MFEISITRNSPIYKTLRYLENFEGRYTCQYRGQLRYFPDPENFEGIYVSIPRRVVVCA